MKVDTDPAIESFGKNKQFKKLFWTFSILMAGQVLA